MTLTIGSDVYVADITDRMLATLTGQACPIGGLTLDYLIDEHPSESGDGTTHSRYAAHPSAEQVLPEDWPADELVVCEFAGELHPDGTPIVLVDRRTMLVPVEEILAYIREQGPNADEIAWMEKGFEDTPDLDGDELSAEDEAELAQFLAALGLGAPAEDGEGE